MMCLAEALLRIPDAHTADELIADKLSGPDWAEKLGQSDSSFVNAATFSLLLTGKVLEGAQRPQRQLAGGARPRRRPARRAGRPDRRPRGDEDPRPQLRVRPDDRRGAAPRRAGARAGAEPQLRHARRGGADDRGRGALRRSLSQRARSHRQGSARAASPSRRASRSSCRRCIRATNGATRDEAKAYILPILRELAPKASKADVHLTIDAEEADRLELQMDMFEALLADDSLFANGWGGLGIAIQAYQKRALPLCEWVVDAARAHRRKLMVRLVKGAYWDTEIKAAQVAGLPDYPVFTRKVATDVSYLACAKVLLAGKDVIYPAFATHNANTIAAVKALGGQDAVRVPAPARHGRGAVRGGREARRGDRRPADAGADLRAGRKPQGIAGLSRPPPARKRRQFLLRQPHRRRGGRPRRSGPRPGCRARGARAQAQSEDRPAAGDLSAPARRNSAGVDLQRPAGARAVAGAAESAREPQLDREAGRREGRGQADRLAARPSDHGRHVVRGDGSRGRPDGPCRRMPRRPAWDALGGEARAKLLDRTADLYEEHAEEFFSLCIREAGKTLVDAVLEVREAVDFLRFYASEARRQFTKPLPLPGPTGEQNELRLHGRGVFAAFRRGISRWRSSPAWSSAPLAAGNAVIAKPAGQTPLIGALGGRADASRRAFPRTSSSSRRAQAGSSAER